MTGIVLFFLIATPTNTVVKQSIDIQIPKGPALIVTPDLPTAIGIGGADKVFILNHERSGVFSTNATDITHRDLSISKLPQNVKVGRKSIFYLKRATSTDFVFTDNSRKNIFYGTNASGYPVIHRIACGPFGEISDLHLTETAADTIQNLLVADRTAGKVYSYVLNTSSSSTLCTTETSVSISNPLWIQSITGATPTVYIGYSDSEGLKLRAFQALNPVTSEKTLTSSLKAQFSRPALDTTSNELFIPIRFADDTVGADYLVKYNSALTTRTNILTCRAPEQVQIDFEGASRYRYVFCPTSYRIDVYDTTDQWIQSLPIGNQPRKMLVGSDGINRFISILQSDQNIVLNRILVAAPSTLTTSTLSLSHTMTDFAQMVGTGAEADNLILAGTDDNILSIVELNSQSLTDTYNLPQSITSLAAQSYSAAHFVSAEADSAYSLTEVNANVWTLRLFDVGGFPLQIGYRSNRLYSLNRDSNDLSVINLTSRAVSSISTQTRPISMDFDTTTNRLWVANETSASVSLVNITPGSEALISNTALPFTPKKLKYQSSDGTLYAGGDSSVRALNAPDLATVSTQGLGVLFTDMTTSTGGVSISSIPGSSLFTMDRTTLTQSVLSSPPHLLSGNATTAVAGQRQEKKVSTFAGLSQTLSSNFSRLFSNASNLFAYQATSKAVYMMPYSLFSTTNFPGYSIEVDLDPQVSSDDGSGNVWMADSDQLKIQRLSSQFQRMVLANAPLNRPENLIPWDAQDKMYIALRNLNAIAILDTTTGSVSYYSVCQSPRQLKLDTAQPKLFVLCPESDSVSAIGLTGAGNFSTQSLIATDKYPIGIELNTTSNRLSVLNSNSNTLLTINSLTHALVSRTSLHERPRAIALNTSNGTLSIAHQDSKYLTQITSAGVQTHIDMGEAGFASLAVNPTSGTAFVINPSLPSAYTYPSIYFTISGSLLTADGHPESVSINATTSKAYVPFPDKDAVSILNETGVQKDVAVGSHPLFAYPLNSATKVFVSNFLDDSVSVISTTTDALTATISLTSGCGPSQMASLDLGGTVYLYVLCQLNDSIEIIHSATLAVGAPVSLRISN
jgi:YVTN family beta-propeller protein